VIPDEVGEELRAAMKAKDIGSHNLSTVDSEARACCMRVLGRRGLGPFKLAIVWPVVTVDVLTGTPDARKFTLDIRELVKDDVAL
jgi:hypothetical protein